MDKFTKYRLIAEKVAQLDKRYWNALEALMEQKGGLEDKMTSIYKELEDITMEVEQIVQDLASSQ